ncbi:MAG: hypothetical protein KC457_22955, partial [Myxococcales bacterium]|nr:hypothetical protein [Myxococcales bacterium]
MTEFDVGQFRNTHTVEVVKHLDGTTVHDSHQAYGDAGLYETRGGAIEHGMCWIESEAARRLRVIEVRKQRCDREPGLIG